LRDALPLVADRVLHRIRETRGGQPYDPRFGVRGRGEGVYADAIEQLFDTTAARLGFDPRGIGLGMGADTRDALPPVETSADNRSDAGAAARSDDVEDVQHDRQAAVSQRKLRAGAGAQLSLAIDLGGRHDGGAPAAKVRA
jgi:hypothetical protein